MIMSIKSYNEQQLIEELRDAFKGFSNAKVESQGEKRWLDNNQRLCDLVMSEDPRNFLQWDVIKRTMEVGDADFIPGELDFLRSGVHWDRWKRAINEVPIGNPTMSKVFPQSSGNLIHHAYHVAQFEKMTSRSVTEMDCVFEFGGGYGGMCRLIHNLGFKGRYIMFDFPAFSALQAYFVKSIGLDVHSLEVFKNSPSGLVCLSDIDQLLESLSGIVPAGNNLLLATWSLSECPIDFRSKIVSSLASFSNFLIAYQGRFEGTDNISFFKDLKANRLDVNWHDIKIEHIPNEFYKDNFYLMGEG